VEFVTGIDLAPDANRDVEVGSTVYVWTTDQKVANEGEVTVKYKKRRTGTQEQKWEVYFSEFEGWWDYTHGDLFCLRDECEAAHAQLTADVEVQLLA
jgi:hypothetical protein